MADRDILELENAEEFADGVDMDQEFGDESISKLKEKAKRRKGRGFEGSAVSRDVGCGLVLVINLLIPVTIPRMENTRGLTRQTRVSPGLRGVSRAGSFL